MKKLLLPAIILTLAFLSATTARSSGGHDTLAFDGAVWENLLGTTCTVTVLSVEGVARGSLPVVESSKTCGEVETWIEYKEMPLKVGDKVTIDEVISTEDGASLTMQAADGTIIVLGPNAKAHLNGACERAANKVAIYLLAGEGKIVEQPAPPPNQTPAPPMGIQTNQLTAVPKGTVYSVNAGREGSTSDHIVKVFEGSVEVRPSLESMQLELASMGGQVNTLNEDLAKGKLTQAEYTRKMLALSMQMQKKSGGLKTSVIVTAGHKCSVDARGVISKVKKLDAGDK